MNVIFDSNEEKLCKTYELNECVKWIKDNNYVSIALQFSKDSLEYSSSIALILKKRTEKEFYISYSTMCCVDYLSIQHLNDSTVDSIIYFGSVCLTSSQFSDSLPVLYVFPNDFESQSLELIETSIVETKANNVIVLYDTYYIYTALELINRIETNDRLKAHINVAQLNSVSPKWNFTPNVLNAIKSGNTQTNDSSLSVGHFSVANKLEEYDLVVYLGQCISIDLIIESNNVLEFDLKNGSKQWIQSNQRLRKRVALIEKFKHNSCQLFAIVFTNPLPPNVNELCAQSKQLAKRLRKKVYFISLVQTIDEYKFGNFPELNAFVVMNSCFCSSAIHSIDYCLPVLNWTEFEIASGLRRHYGGVEWNESTDAQTDGSDSDEPDINDLNKQLIETQVFERNKWFGLEVNAGADEPSLVKSGQKGIASEYENENLL